MRYGRIAALRRCTLAFIGLALILLNASSGQCISQEQQIITLTSNWTELTQNANQLLLNQCIVKC